MIRPLIFLAAFLVAAPPSPQTLRYAPAEGTRLTRVMQTSTELDMEGMHTVMNGQEIPPEYMPEIELTALRAMTLVVTDRIGPVTAGRPLELERTFEQYASQGSESVTMDGQTQTKEGRATSSYEGRAVRFQWDGDEEAYAATTTDDGEAVEGLFEDLDLRGFLPASGVEPGDTWTVDATALAQLLEPGGDLDLTWEGDGLTDSQGEEREQGGLQGEIQVRFGGLQDNGLALLELSGEVEAYEEAAGDLEHIPVAEGTATITTTTDYQLEGRIFWSLEAERLESLELETDMTVESLTEKDPGQDGGEFATTVTLIGTWECRISVRDA